MNDDTVRQEGATDPDQPRLGPTEDDNDYSLSLEQVGDLFAEAGFPRDLRTLQRYCRKGRLKAKLFEFPYGERYLITPQSVERRIAYLMELQLAAVGRGEPGSAAATDSEEIQDSTDEQHGATDPDQPRLTVANDDAMSRYVAGLEEQVAFLRGEIVVKNEQIKDLAEHARSTNNVIAAIARRLPLLGGGEREHPYRPDEGAGDNKQAKL